MTTSGVTPKSFLKDGWAPYGSEITDEMRDLRDKLQNLSQRAESEQRDLSDGEQEQVTRYVRGIDKLIEAGEVEHQQRIEHLKRLADNPNNLERTFDEKPASTRTEQADESVPPQIRTARDAGLRTIERHKDLLSPQAADNLDGLLRSRDPMALGARYLEAVSSPHYNAAFGKLVADPTTGHLRMTAQEVDAMRKVSAIEAERALSVGVTTAGRSPTLKDATAEPSRPTPGF